MVNTVNRSSRVPQEASADDIAHLIATMDRTSLALSQMSVSLAQDGTFVLNVPLGSFVVSPTPIAVSACPSNAVPQSQPAVTVPTPAEPITPVDPSTLNVGPTPEEVVRRIADQDPAGSWYVVTRGLEVGVFKDLHEVTPLTSGVSGSSHSRASSLTKAIETYIRCWNAGGIRRL